MPLEPVFLRFRCQLFWQWLWYCHIAPHCHIATVLLLPHCLLCVNAAEHEQCLGVQHCISQDCRRRLILPDFPRGAFEVLSPPSCGGQCTTYKRRRKRKKGGRKGRKQGGKGQKAKKEEEVEILRGAPPTEKIK